MLRASLFSSFCLRRCGQLAFVLAALLALTISARAQFGPPPAGTEVHDASVLKPPAGARVAIVEFLDLECPDCARANPLVKEAVGKYKIPLLRHDFPLPFHLWSLDAAVNARWFDSKEIALGNEYRDQVFLNQSSLHSREDLAAYTQKFAKEHKLELPANVDPDGKFLAMVKADYALGQKIGVEHTPTIWIVTAGSKGTPFVEIVDRGQLFQMIEQALADTGKPEKKQ
jgi:protein-disulfide isomerase